MSGSLTSTNEDEDPFVLDSFISDDGNHHVIWGGDGPYPVWFCSDHNQAYYNYCLGGQELAEKAYSN